MIQQTRAYSTAALGLAIAQARRAAGLTVDQAAERSGISRRHLLDLEHGKKKPLITTLADVADGLGIPLGLLAERGWIAVEPPQLP
ncbi:helix-turn-helix transcriptional regulator [Actinoplanes sp. NPDC026670]|uniref:helix-turn-helix domain-containing protein n=1 Tax=Actinoplanes sp. NPDC026670 TaxID=3154700 RepID=UPI003403C759